MGLEAAAAALVGAALLWVVLEPLVQPRAAPPPVVEPVDPEETEKGVALAALKEIEFDRETGKLSDADYAALKAKYTAAALEALRADEEHSPPPGDVEALIAAKVRRLRSAAASAPTCPACGPCPELDARFCSSCGQPIPGVETCTRCAATLPPGSRFCEACGSQVAA